MNIKNKVDITGQKIKGIAQQIKGEFEVMTGNTVKGKIDKIRGKANVVTADLLSTIKDDR